MARGKSRAGSRARGFLGVPLKGYLSRAAHLGDNELNRWMGMIGSATDLEVPEGEMVLGPLSLSCKKCDGEGGVSGSQKVSRPTPSRFPAPRKRRPWPDPGDTLLRLGGESGGGALLGDGVWDCLGMHAPSKPCQGEARTGQLLPPKQQSTGHF